MAMLLSLAVGAARAQVQMSRRNIEDLMPLCTAPLFTLVSMAILIYSGRADLAGYSLVAAVLMSIERMATLTASEILVNERWGQTFELAVASPSPYVVVLATRIVVLSSLGLVGFVESWLLARVVFGVSVTIYHPLVMAATLLATIFAAACTSLIFASIFCFGRTPRTYQNGISGPLYLLGGVIVPVTFLPTWVQPVSRFIFFYWSADLLRESLQPGNPGNVLLRLGAIIILGVAAALIGILLFRRMLDHNRREGVLGLA